MPGTLRGISYIKGSIDGLGSFLEISPNLSLNIQDTHRDSFPGM